MIVNKKDVTIDKIGLVYMNEKKQNQLKCKGCSNTSFAVFSDTCKCTKCKSEIAVQVTVFFPSIDIDKMNESFVAQDCYVRENLHV